MKFQLLFYDKFEIEVLKRLRQIYENAIINKILILLKKDYRLESYILIIKLC